MSDLAGIERWRGETDARLRDAERRLEALNGNIARGADALQRLQLTVRGYTAVAAVVSPALTSVAVYFITH